MQSTEQIYDSSLRFPSISRCSYFLRGALPDIPIKSMTFLDSFIFFQVIIETKEGSQKGNDNLFFEAFKIDLKSKGFGAK